MDPDVHSRLSIAAIFRVFSVLPITTIFAITAIFAVVAMIPATSVAVRNTACSREQGDSAY
jgi:hypothetical protein